MTFLVFWSKTDHCKGGGELWPNLNALIKAIRVWAYQDQTKTKYFLNKKLISLINITIIIIKIRPTLH